MKKVVCLIPLLLASTSSFAAAQDVRGFYVGLGVGSTSFEDDGWNGEVYDTSFDEKDNSFKIFSGYQFNRIIGIEASYTTYGEIDSQADNYQIDPTSFSVSANVGYTFSNGLRPFALAGLSAVDLSQSEERLDGDSGGAIHYGLGLDYAPAMLNGFSMRLAYEGDLFGIEEKISSYTVRSYDVTVGSFYLGASYKF
ncbi:porin family protein [Photobacterium sp. SDRW27]|uniref:porin family protein n=1 Tax=Photobacterium obscurum TaxID=2829490 RepID=UPI0022439E0D|nr:porin family protein [Photobacterium obscurum]MCW8331211.1 porin family protein [Photobacterium obscurum]